MEDTATTGRRPRCLAGLLEMDFVAIGGNRWRDSNCRRAEIAYLLLDGCSQNYPNYQFETQFIAVHG